MVFSGSIKTFVKKCILHIVGDYMKAWMKILIGVVSILIIAMIIGIISFYSI